MISADTSSRTYDFYESTKDRNPYKPNSGFRRSLGTHIITQGCDKLVGGDRIDRHLSAYASCSFELTPKQYKANNYERIVVYADTPREVYSFIETC